MKRLGKPAFAARRGVEEHDTDYGPLPVMRVDVTTVAPAPPLTVRLEQQPYEEPEGRVYLRVDFAGSAELARVAGHKVSIGMQATADELRAIAYGILRAVRAAEAAGIFAATPPAALIERAIEQARHQAGQS